MSVEVYSEVRIQFNPTDGQDPGRTYSNRCLIELRQHDIGDYALRAIDLGNQKFEIFNLPLIRRDQYLFASTADQPDIINGINGTYRLWLNPDSRDNFHNILRTCLNEFIIVKYDDACLSSVPQTSNYSNFLNEQEQQLKHKLQQMTAFQDELRALANEAYYRNEEEFECLICLETISKTNGILFHDCLHPLCKRCLLHMIETSTEPLLKCPHDDCTTLIGEAELRGVVKDMEGDQKMVDRLNEIGMRHAESRSKTFHCITPDCNQWWFIEQEEDTNIVLCIGCKHWVCMTCAAIHEGQNCHEYQEDLKIRAMHDGNVRKDIEHLEEMIKNKEAMYCPGCRVIIQKLSGCDWLQCTQCKMEICWPTRGSRWGPGGRGDTSGGCRCRVDNGKLCTPNCQNCH